MEMNLIVMRSYGSMYHTTIVEDEGPAAEHMAHYFVDKSALPDRRRHFCKEVQLYENTVDAQHQDNELKKENI